MDCCVTQSRYKFKIVSLPFTSAHLIVRSRHILPKRPFCATRDGTPRVSPWAVARHSGPVELVQALVSMLLLVYFVMQATAVLLGLLRRHTRQRGSELVRHSLSSLCTLPKVPDTATGQRTRRQQRSVNLIKKWVHTRATDLTGGMNDVAARACCCRTPRTTACRIGRDMEGTHPFPRQV